MVAAAQVVYSLQLGLGGVTAYASYNRYHHNLVRDTGLILATNLVWVVLASLLVLSLLGVTHNLQVELSTIFRESKRSGHLKTVSPPEMRISIVFNV